ncbi:MAG: glycoside hydrolase family 3 N-terminal domain-containing protein, partial [Gemmatimonadota bacterium]
MQPRFMSLWRSPAGAVRPRLRALCVPAVALVALAACSTLSGTGGAEPPAPSPAEPVPPPATPLPAGPPAEPEPPDPAAWVEATLASLTLEEKVGQLVVPWIDGSLVPVGSPAWERLRRWVVEDGVGGFVVSVGPPLEIAAKLNALQRMARVPLLMAADVERGPAQRLADAVVLPYGIRTGGATEFPPAMGVGATGDPRLSYEIGRITAAEVRAVGIHMAYAPVVDVNNNPANPIINTRSFGSDPALVARMGAARVLGLQEHGVYATAKHFPGHGDTSLDSHLALNYLGFGRARADSVELPPFRAAIEAGVTAVMVANVAFPGLAGDSLPATLSPQLTTGLLVEDLGFDGLVVVDALDMDAVAALYTVEQANVRAIQAGADVLLMPTSAPRAMGAVIDAVRRGEIPEARIDRSVRKILALKAGQGLHRQRFVDVEAVPLVVGSPAHQPLARAAAERSITVPRDQNGLLPLDPARTPRVLSVQYVDDTDPYAGDVFHRALAGSFREVRRIRLDRGSHPAALADVRRAAASADLVLFSAYVRVGDRKGGIGIPDSLAALAGELAAGKPTVLLSFGNPYILEQVPDAGTLMLAWAGHPPLQQAAADALLGRIPVTGKLPLDLPPFHVVGEGLEIPARTAAGTTRRAPRTAPLQPAPPEAAALHPRLPAVVDSIVLDALAEGAAPGAAVAVGRGGKLVHLAGYGRTDYAPDAPAVSDSTLWDMASLTKVVATTTALMLLVDDGRMELDAPLARYLPEWAGGGRPAITIRDLLLHRAGLPAYGATWQTARGREAYLREILALPQAYPPRTRTVYSDYGAILMALAAERVTGMELDAFMEERIFAPLGMRDTGFNPVGWRDVPYVVSDDARLPAGVPSCDARSPANRRLCPPPPPAAGCPAPPGPPP